MSRGHGSLALILLAVPGALVAPQKGSPGSASPSGGIAKEEHLAFVANKTNPVQNLSFLELRKILLGDKTHWPNGRKITLVMREPGQLEREAVLRQVYRWTESDYNRYFLQATFTGKVQAPPKVLSTAKGVLDFVSLVPGAVGFVCVRDLDDSVKVIEIDGVAPDDPRYRFTVKAR